VRTGSEKIGSGRARAATFVVLAIVLVAGAIWLYSGTASRRAIE
jgi:hypothetical protein